ncbi:MAG: hypothetical protein ABS98_17275 [Lysobacteraceae bacterium SCN 69-48]|nr:MAG: hypothetical protein ABS98_17275 [Xanthomonadaceae bacterium SCN 69-48]
MAAADALQLTTLRPLSWVEAKRAITPTAVRKINEAIVRIWPPDTDVARALKRSDDRQIAFYSGDYHPQRLLGSVGRHLIYADVVALADPFQYPLNLRDEFNPLLHPEKHLTNTAKNLMVWFQLADLIRQGLVEVIRLPSDFDPLLQRSNLQACESLVERHPELKKLVEKYVHDRVEDDFADEKEWFTLIQPDWHIVKTLKKEKANVSDEEVAEFLQYIRHRRDQHPFFVESGNSELLAETTGSTVYDSVQVASISGAYMLTDLEPRWRQFQFLQREAEAPIDGRTRVARGLQNIRMPMASHLNLELARRIREENQLSRVRSLLDKLMRQAGNDNPLSDSEAHAFQQELEDAIAEAKDEYASIDRALLAWTGSEIAGLGGLYGLTGGALTISLGAAAAAGVINLVGAKWQRRTFKARYPAAMLMNIPVGDR